MNRAVFLAGLPDGDHFFCLSVWNLRSCGVLSPVILMALTRTQKVAQVTDLTEKMKNASSVIFTQYIGLTVSNITKLRGNLRKEDAELQVAKKSLIKLAAKGANAPEIADEALPGPVACIFSYGEPTSGAGITYTFGKDHPQIKLVGGIFDGKILSAEQALTMATIPSKNVLLAMFMSVINSPLTSFASAVSSPLTGFARALAEIAKKKESEAPAPAAPVAEAAPAPAAAPEAPAVAEAAPEAPAPTAEAPALAAPVAEAAPEAPAA